MPYTATPAALACPRKAFSSSPCKAGNAKPCVAGLRADHLAGLLDNVPVFGMNAKGRSRILYESLQVGMELSKTAGSSISADSVPSIPITLAFI